MTELINSIYLEDDTREQLREHFQSSSGLRSVSLSEFFTRDTMQKLIEEIGQLEFIKDHHHLSHRRHRANLPPTIKDLFESKEFLQLINFITGESFSAESEIYLYKFGHSEYQIINDDTVLPAGIDIICDLTPEWVDELGGIVSYTDGEGQFYHLPPNFGSVSIVERDEKHHYFVKYVNHYAENLNRYLIISNSSVER